MNKRIFLIFISLMNLICIILAFIMFSGEVQKLSSEILYLRNKDFELECKIQDMNEKCEETENKCQRMTDSCIYILSNKSWE